MKKLFVISAVVMLLGLTLTSCKKDYTCNCTEPTGTTNQSFPIDDASKDDAESACDQLDATYAIVGGGCTLD